MGIIYNEKARTFTLHTHNTTYQMQIDAYGFLLHLYYGRKTDGVMDYLLTMQTVASQEIRRMQEMTEHILLMRCRRNFRVD